MPEEEDDCEEAGDVREDVCEVTDWFEPSEPFELFD